ncbi:MAG: DUF1311 domain-containing protein [Burkholderiales bacterium]|nr:DUF1311 domain-containing protein [Burkholderiales bacterium]
MLPIRLLFLSAAALVALPAIAQLRAPPPAPAPPPAAAAPGASGGPPPADPLTREFRDCVAKVQSNRSEDAAAIHLCLTAEIKRQDGKLNAAAQRVQKLLPPEGRKRLDAANADWRRYRTSECAFMAEENAPPPANLQNADCRLRMTAIRASDLDGLAGMLARQEAAAKAQQEAPGAAPPAAAPAAPAAKQ